MESAKEESSSSVVDVAVDNVSAPAAITKSLDVQHDQEDAPEQQQHRQEHTDLNEAKIDAIAPEVKCDENKQTEASVSIPVDEHHNADKVEIIISNTEVVNTIDIDQDANEQSVPTISRLNESTEEPMNEHLISKGDDDTETAFVKSLAVVKTAEKVADTASEYGSAGSYSDNDHDVDDHEGAVPYDDSDIGAESIDGDPAAATRVAANTTDDGDDNTTGHGDVLHDGEESNPQESDDDVDERARDSHSDDHSDHGHDHENDDEEEEDGRRRVDSEEDDDEDDEDASVILEREEGDGQESVPQRKVDDDEDKKNPQYIPKRGTFYEHDDRTAEDVEGEEGPEEAEKLEKDPKKKVWSEKKERWSHDKFKDNDQLPKSRDELISIYGYDIRNEDGPPRARRRRRYGRGPNKYTRNWEDEDAYNKPPGVNKKPPRPRREGRGDIDGPLHESTDDVSDKIEISQEAGTESPEPQQDPVEETVVAQKDRSRQELEPQVRPGRNSGGGVNSRQMRNPRIGSGRVVKPSPQENREPDSRPFTKSRNFNKSQHPKDDYVQSQNFSNRRHRGGGGGGSGGGAPPLSDSNRSEFQPQQQSYENSSSGGSGATHHPVHPMDPSSLPGVVDDVYRGSGGGRGGPGGGGDSYRGHNDGGYRDHHDGRRGGHHRGGGAHNHHKNHLGGGRGDRGNGGGGLHRLSDRNTSNNQHQVQEMPPSRMQQQQQAGAEQHKGGKRYSSIRQRSLPETTQNPATFTHHTGYYNNEYNQNHGQPSGVAVQQQQPPPPPNPPPPILPLPQLSVPTMQQAAQQQQQVAVPPQSFVAAPPGAFPPAPHPPPQAFLQGAPPPPFLAQPQPAAILNYVAQQQGQPQYAPAPPPQAGGYTTPYQQQFNPVTYYSPEQQAAQRLAPTKRPKAAIPIVPPPPNEPRGRGRGISTIQQQQLGADRNMMSPSHTGGGDIYEDAVH